MTTAILDRFGEAPIDGRVARCHARLAGQLLEAGQVIGTHDSWIAATGLAYGHAVVTANTGEFHRLAGLDVIEIAL
ncbi:MAG: hypothetical protein ACC661_10685 [Verrucomicrobiales bacterium]